MLLAWRREGLIGLQLTLVTHGAGAADDEDHDDEKGGHNDEDEQILLQEVHDSSEDKVLQANHGDGDGGRDGPDEAGGFGGSRDLSRGSRGKGGWENEFRLCFISAAVHGGVGEERSGVAQREKGHAGDEKKQTGRHLLL